MDVLKVKESAYWKKKMDLLSIIDQDSSMLGGYRPKSTSSATLQRSTVVTFGNIVVPCWCVVSRSVDAGVQQQASVVLR